MAMASGFTAFSGLQPVQRYSWVKEIVIAAREMAFFSRFTGTGPGSLCQRITELKKMPGGGLRALMALVPDLTGDGTINDNERTQAEQMTASWFELVIDQLAHVVKNYGKLEDQASVIEFRLLAKEKLTFWLAEKMDEIAFLVLSGVSLSYKCNGAARTNSPWPNLRQNALITAPSSQRHLRWTGSALAAGDTTAIDTGHLWTYGGLVQMGAFMRVKKIKPLSNGNDKFFAVLMEPRALAALKQTADYKAALWHAYPRSKDNPIFSGADVMVDGFVIHSHLNCYNTTGASSGNKWGAAGTIDGTRTMFCGAQALGMIDLGQGDWHEQEENMGNRQAISLDRMFGYGKPRYHSNVDDSVQDFGCVAVDTYLPT